MAFEDDLRRALGAGAADEVEALKRQVAALQRVVAVLADALTYGEPTYARALQKKLLAAARAPSDERDPEEAPAVDASPYRGMSAADVGTLRCATCGKPIDPDDPELTLDRAGRVCVMCFQRGG